VKFFPDCCSAEAVVAVVSSSESVFQRAEEKEEEDRRESAFVGVDADERHDRRLLLRGVYSCRAVSGSALVLSTSGAIMYASDGR
jgi:hypothetical protein